MKKMSPRALKHPILICLFIFLFAGSARPAGYEIRIHVNGLKDTICYLGYHFGDKQYIKDTVRTDQSGWAVFKGKDSLPGGIYLVVMPNKTYFEILVNEQKFSIETDTLDFITNFKVTGSLENKLFNEHQLFIMSKSRETQMLKARMEIYKDNPDSAKALREVVSNMDKDVKAYRLKLMSDYPKAFLTKIFKTMSEPEIPPSPRDARGNLLDS